MNKKIKIILICLIVLIVAIASFVLLKDKFNNSKDADNSSLANFEVKDIKCKSDEEIIVDINLLNDSNFVAANFEYKYDKDSLEYIEYELGESLKNGAMTMVNNDEANHKVLIGYIANPEEDDLTIKRGNIISLKFKVKKGLTKQSIKNTFDCTTLKEDDGTDIQFKIKQGLIEVE